MVQILINGKDRTRKYDKFGRSLPTRGAWIESMRVRLPGSGCLGVAPHTGAWVEI